MKDQKIELPPLPTINVMGKERPQIWFTASEVDVLRRAAVEADRQRRGELVAEAVELLRGYLRLCKSLPRGDGYHLRRIENAISSLESPQPAEPVKVPSDAEVDALAHEIIATSGAWENWQNLARRILARFAQHAQPAACKSDLHRGDCEPAASAEPVGYFQNVNSMNGLPPQYEQVCASAQSDDDVFPLYAAPVATQPSVQDILFDGWAVLQAIDERARERTLAIHVADVLDAVVRLMRPTLPADGQAQQDADKADALLQLIDEFRERLPSSFLTLVDAARAAKEE